MFQKEVTHLKPDDVFGQVLKSIRLKMKLSQEELAFRSNLDRTYISMLERGVNQPTLNSLFSLSNALQMKTSKLVELVEKEVEKSE